MYNRFGTFMTVGIIALLVTSLLVGYSFSLSGSQPDWWTGESEGFNEDVTSYLVGGSGPTFSPRLCATLKKPDWQIYSFIKATFKGGENLAVTEEEGLVTWHINPKNGELGDYKSLPNCYLLKIYLSSSVDGEPRDVVSFINQNGNIWATWSKFHPEESDTGLAQKAKALFTSESFAGFLAMLRFSALNLGSLGWILLIVWLAVSLLLTIPVSLFRRR